MPNAILAPQPPRRISRVSTKNESETFASEPATKESVNLPPKLIMWSPPTEPATATFIIFY